MGKLDLTRIDVRRGSGYPRRYAARLGDRRSLSLGDAAGLTQFGAKLTILGPGAMSSMRHWHEEQDELVWMVSGELVLVDEDGETPMRPGDCACFPAGEANGHHLVNRGDREARFLVVGTRTPREVAHYPDIDLRYELDEAGPRFTRADGSPLGAGPDAT